VLASPFRLEIGLPGMGDVATAYAIAFLQRMSPHRSALVSCTIQHDAAACDAGLKLFWGYT